MRALRIRRDLNGQHVVVGYESVPFSSEADAIAGAELAIAFSRDEVAHEMSQESRYRRASNNSSPRAAAE